MSRSTRYVALLRAINLGRARQVGMPRLRELLTSRGTPASAPTCAAATSSSTVPCRSRSWRRTWRR
ncbi:DUF1697 domain-containing protein [Blastococcus brunescens]|uniref:DUF1697 domain-containing protein n=1 Tax=Blastococcus brunescens TaxID=1564165 RepID=A0ABZ1AZJ6_9ACTN|nr:DUF1697 domain-containing protein [Blastococcus sp. BMG 8361]WRL63899.1 DUF1697 domain-containing protein [Blastococcus sp. BMG 8361]